MKRPNLYDRLKVLAILTMIIDHVGYVFLPEISWLRLIGRIAFPIFLFLVGFNGKYSRRWDILIWAILVQIPVFVASMWFDFGGMSLNILFGIVLGRVVLQLVESRKSKVEGQKKGLWTLWTLGLLTVVLLLIHPLLAQVVEYGSFVILFPLMGWLFKLVEGRKSKVEGQKKGLCTLWTLGLLTYGVVIFASLFFFTQTVFAFSVVQLVVLAGFFILLLCIFFLLGQGNIFLPIGKKIDTGVLFVSKNALLVYIFHLLVLWLIKLFLMGRWGA